MRLQTGRKTVSKREALIGLLPLLHALAVPKATWAALLRSKASDRPCTLTFFNKTVSSPLFRYPAHVCVLSFAPQGSPPAHSVIRTAGRAWADAPGMCTRSPGPSRWCGATTTQTGSFSPSCRRRESTPSTRTRCAQPHPQLPPHLWTSATSSVKGSVCALQTHPWLAVDAETGQVVQEYTAGEGFQLVPIEEPAASGSGAAGSPSSSGGEPERLPYSGWDGLGSSQDDYAPAEVHFLILPLLSAVYCLSRL